MSYIPEPTDPVIRLELGRDQLLVPLWAEFCAQHLSQGRDPNSPSRYTRSFRDFANHRMEALVDGAGLIQYKGWKTVGTSELAIRAHERSDLAGRVIRWWGKALDLLDQLLSVAEEFGMFHWKRLDAAPDGFPRTYPLLIDLHSRGVQVAEETLALLRAGFAAGAEARWRTLHETAVIAAFIAKHGVDTVTRYAEHDHVRVKKAMDSEQEHHRELGIAPYTDEEMKEAADRYEGLKKKYGPAFLGDYGWAAHALGRESERKSPTFLDIEASLGLRVHRAAYKSASQAIHAGPGALVDNPGKMEGVTPPFLMRGTEFGLVEPGARTAGSIGLLSHALMEWRPYPFDRITLKAMDHMVKDVGALFLACGRRMEAEFGKD